LAKPRRLDVHAGKTDLARIGYCESFTSFGNASFPSAILAGQSATCLAFCHTRPVT
jgi:hypothetical protein